MKLAGAWLPFSGVDLVDGTPVTLNGSINRKNGNLFFPNVNSSADYIESDRIYSVPADQCTLFMIVKPSFGTGQSGFPFLFSTDTATGAAVEGIRILYNSTIDDYRFIVHAGGSSATADFTSNSSFQDQIITMVGRYNGVNMDFYLNGIVQATTAKTGNVTVSTINAIIGNDGQHALSSFSGEIFATYLFYSALSEAQILSLHRDPWQILKPIRQNVLFTPEVAPVQPQIVVPLPQLIRRHDGRFL